VCCVWGAFWWDLFLGGEREWGAFWWGSPSKGERKRERKSDVIRTMAGGMAFMETARLLQMTVL